MSLNYKSIDVILREWKRVLQRGRDMIDKYNAFISYRHAPLDSKIAAHVQKSLERFHIPDKIRKSTGKKRIERIFRDKDELPITSDLTETISGALENSDYLIVICSENTKESFWVKREIEYFLRSHSRDHVLTVLAGGEPQDVIPEALLTQEKTFTDENGVEHTVKAPLEPLSCDYRLPMRKADKEELPRLASAIIGCSYDELMNRRRAYTIRRVALLTTLLFALMLALVVYMDHTNKQIKENLDKAIRARSTQLANESMTLYADGDRIEALHVALASVPEEYPDAPVPPETVRALVDATGAYTTLEGFDVVHAWNFYMPGRISDYVINDEGDRMAARDTEGNVYVWNTKSHELLMTFPPEANNDTHIAFVTDTTLLVMMEDTNVAYNVDTGDEVWTLEVAGADEYLGKVDDTHCAIVDYSPDVRIVDVTDGTVTAQYNLGDDVVLMDACYDETGSKMGFIAVGYDVSLVNVFTVGCMDLNSGAVTYSEVTGNVLSNIIFLSDGELCYTEYTDFNTNYVYGQVELYYENHVCVKKVSSVDLSLIWENSFDYLGYGSELNLIELGSDAGVCVYSGPVCNTYDIATGEQIHNYALDDYIIDVSDRDEDGNALIITGHGSLVFGRSATTNDVAIYDSLIDDLVEAKVNDGIYVCREFGDYIMYYDVGLCDENIQLTEDMIPLSYYEVDTAMTDDCLVIYNELYEEGHQILLVDCMTNEVRKVIDIDDEGGEATIKLAGAYNDTVYVFKRVDQTVTLISIDTNDYKQDEIWLTDDSFYIYSGIRMYGPRFLLPLNRNTGYDILVYNVETEETEIYETDVDVNDYFTPLNNPIYIDGADLIYVSFSNINGDIYETLIDADGGDLIDPEVPDEWTSIHRAVYDPVSETIILTDNSHIVRLNEEGEFVDEISTGGRTVLLIQSIKINDEDLILVVYNDGSIVRYDPSDMSFIGSTEISGFYNMYDIDGSIEYDEDENLLFIQLDSLTDVVDTTYWVEVSAVEDSLGYNSQADGFFVSYRDPESTDNVLGFFKRYTVDELIEMGTSYLDGSVLPEYRRARYGI